MIQAEVQGVQSDRVVWCCLLALLLSLLVAVSPAAAAGLDDLIGPDDALLVTAQNGQTVIARHIDRPLIPASTLKLLTALSAWSQLGPNYRFTTDFYLSPDADLIIRGNGDPLLVSEVVAAYCNRLAPLLAAVDDLYVDDTAFAYPIDIPGRSDHSLQPYDAPNGALCVNFNTVFYKRDRNGRLVSAEPQTPLLPFARKRIGAQPLTKGRIVLTHDRHEIGLYSGHLFRYFLSTAAVPVNGAVRIGRVDPQRDRLIFQGQSPYDLATVIARMLEYSNNFMANQLLLAAAAECYGPPATLTKALAVAHTYARQALGIKALSMVEGSGLSRRNRISARALDRILAAFARLRHLMPSRGSERYKTGTLTDIRTRVGFFENGSTGGRYRYRYVLMLNTPGKNTDRVMQWLRRRLMSIQD